jgi:pteridine reductase
LNGPALAPSMKRKASRVPAPPAARAPKKAAAGARRRRPASPRHDLHGRTALVTGGAVRVGAAVARHLAAAGCDVVVHYNESLRPAKDLVASLQARGVHAAIVAGDLAKAADRRRLLPAAAKAIGRPIDLLVNNASSFPVRRLMDLEWEDLLDDLAVNAWAPFELTRAFAEQLPKGRDGMVVNFLDARIVDEDRRHVGYHFAKRMLADVTRLCAIELAPRIAVNAVAPGPTLPPPGMDPRKGAALMERLRQRLPLQRTSTPDDLARAVVYLAGSRAHTGQVLFVDGGRHLGRPES